MPAFNFEKEFADPVARFEKLNTIRQKQKCKVGDPVYLFTGQRTKQCRKLGEAVCTEVYRVRIAEGTLSVWDGEEVGKIYHTGDSLNLFAQRDGFKDYPVMLKFFRERYGIPFNGWFHAWKPKQ